MIRKSAVAAFLCLVLLVTSLAFGAARGQARVAGQLVLCVGGAAVSVAVDATGQPVGQVHLCPDCALAGLAAIAGAVPRVVAPETLAVRMAYPRRASRTVALWRLRASARGPPRFPV